MPRLDSTLENVGAEFLVLGNLLIEKIPSFKAYVNFPGYDIVATNPKTEKSCYIQVKSRWATDANGFLIKNFDCNFVVVVFLNRGYRHSPKRNLSKIGPSEPKYYVIPVGIVENARYEKGWGKVYLGNIEQVEQYVGRWDLIKEFLGIEETQYMDEVVDQGET